MSREIKITRAGYLYIDGKKAAERKIGPFYGADEILAPDEMEIARKWISKNFTMCDPYNA